MKRSSMRGFSLIELLLVLGIILLVAAAGFWLYSTVQDRAKTERDVNAVFRTMAAARAGMGGRGIAGSEDLPLNFFPSEMKRFGRVLPITTAWGMDIRAYFSSETGSYTTCGATCRHVRFIWGMPSGPFMPVGECTQFVSRIWKESTWVSVGGTTKSSPTADLDVKAVVQGCAASQPIVNFVMPL